VYESGPYLIFQLNRFNYETNEKLDDFVMFPLNGLDISVVMPDSAPQKEMKNS
jgi:hypothetical protein